MGSHWRTARPVIGGNQPGGPHIAQVTLRKLDSLPPLPSGAIFKPFEVSEPAPYKIKTLERFFLFVVTAASLVAAFILLFVET